jgi:hypothetical protein
MIMCAPILNVYLISNASSAKFNKLKHVYLSIEVE